MKRKTQNNSQPVTVLVSAEELADHLGVSNRTVRRWVDQKILPEPIKINTRVHRYNLHACLSAVANINNGVAQ